MVRYRDTAELRYMGRAMLYLLGLLLAAAIAELFDIG
jgi:hypothetical protein